MPTPPPESLSESFYEVLTHAAGPAGSLPLHLNFFKILHAGCFLMTALGLVPGNAFTLQPQDFLSIRVSELALYNRVVLATHV